ncbi:MAG: transporter [Legionellales bacterium]|jgi:hypothetical protein
MNIRTLYKKLFFIALLPNIAWAETPLADPCASLLAVLNRPTVADSSCVVKSGKVVIEMGTQYKELYLSDGHEYNYPEAQLRFGLPEGNEFTILTPNYISSQHLSGYTATTLGLKHQFVPIGPLVYTAESLFTLPSGDHNFGSEGLGVAVNAIVSYDFTATLSTTIMLGYSSQTTAYNNGGEQYSSFNPDLVITWQPLQSLQFYAEVYGQTKTGPEESAGYNTDAGIQYLFTKNIEVDFGFGQRLSGTLDDFSHYLSAGGAVSF